MATTYNVSTPRHTVAPTRPGLSPFGDCCVALCVALGEWYERQRIRAKLFDLSDRELHDIGISRGEIDYVASNRDIDPRGIRSAG
ncbi:DUF1127 domain-containing protein [Bradyrhizobium monzae]|uniref:DUF1127 domain-containing protein n=1 Tax=Bradyrhizobium sp. Oc8 TaxID=2876780 RepID=UPI00320B74DE